MPIETKCNFLQKTSEDHIEFFAWDLLILTWCFGSYFLRGKRVSPRYAGQSRYYCDRECMWMRRCDCECGAKCRWALSEPFVKKCRLLSQAGRQSVTQSVSQSPPSDADIHTHTHTVAVPSVCVCFLRASKNKTTLKNANARRPTERPTEPANHIQPIDIEATDARPQPNARLPSHTHTEIQRLSTHAHPENDSDKQRRVQFI